MAGPTPIVHRKQAPELASYDWVDITSGTGYRRYYACAGRNNVGTILKFLTPRLLDAEFTYHVAAAGAPGTVFDLDFDIEFKRPAYVEGDCFINATVTHAAAGPSTWLEIFVYHYDGSTETQLGTFVTPGRAVNGEYRECMKFALTGHHFAIGDILRLTVQVETDGITTTSGVYHDPNSRVTVTDQPTATAVNTDLILDCPFRIDI